MMVEWIGRGARQAALVKRMVAGQVADLGSYHYLDPPRQSLWRAVRRFAPRRQRFFFEGCIQVPGQLWYPERELLYETVRRHRPEVVFEVGTWLGGGSTLFIAQALHDNGRGTLHTIELDRATHAVAVAGYRSHLPHLLPHVTFHIGSSTTVYPPILAGMSRIDCVLLDGIEPNVTLSEFDMFEPLLAPGAVLMAHDWADVKMSLVRPRLEASAHWVLEQLIEPPTSPGFAVLRRSA